MDVCQIPEKPLRRLELQAKLRCAECHRFVEAVRGIRGPLWRARDRARLRHAYLVAGPYRDGAVRVGGQFFELFVDKTCSRWVGHLAEQDDPCGHTRELPGWIARLPESVDFDRKVGREAAVRVAAAVLGVSPRAVYRGVEA
jgi:hypothetical protein